VSYPEDYKYSKDHEWIKTMPDGTGIVGITDHAQDQLGDVVFVELPEIGSKYEKGDVFGVVESVKAVVDCYIPVSGEVTEVNDRLETEVELINSEPHDNGWMIKIRLSNPEELNELLDSSGYESHIAESAG